MRRRYLWLITGVISAIGIIVGVVAAVEPPTAWLLESNPTLDKVIDLPDNVPPLSSNWDCDAVSLTFAGTTSPHDDCVVQTPYGLASGNGIVFNGSSEQITVSPPNGYYGLQPIPGQGMYFTYSQAPIRGLYMSFFTSIWDKVDPVPRIIDGRLQYKMIKGPDFALNDIARQPLSLNTSAVAFSPNGSWMVAEVRTWGFIRVNMATFEITRFAPPTNYGSDNASYNSFLTISNDGRSVALKPGNEPTFRVYDLSGCGNVGWPVTYPGCPNRDYWPYLNSQLPGLRALYLPRFNSENQLSISVIYNYTPTQFKVAQYKLTAPGVDPKGIEYLGMGDSYASGQGAFSYTAGTDTANSACHLSGRSYPFLLSANLFSSGRSVACSGAKIKDIVGDSRNYAGQNTPNINKKELERLNLLPQILANFSPGYLLQSDFVQKYNPQAVTLSISGNDIGFADIVSRCVMPAIVNTTCYPTYEDQQELAKRIEGIESKLKSTYRAVSAPGRRVYVIGYPQIVVGGGNCAANVKLDDKEIEMFIGLTDTLNRTIKRAADSAGVRYVDVSQAFAGRRMCENNSLEVAVNGVTAGNDSGWKGVKFIGNESFHPNELGHDLLRRAILLQTNNLKQPMPGVKPPGASTGSLPLTTAPKTGRPVFQSVSDSTLAPPVLARRQTVSVRIDPATAILRPSSPVSVRFDSDTTAIASGMTDASGGFSGSVVVPPSSPCGPNTLRIVGQNAANQPIEVVKEVYITSETGDCNNNGTPDDTEPCGILPPAGVDIDRDGIDDACDGAIGKPPTYSVYMTGSSIHAVRPTQ